MPNPLTIQKTSDSKLYDNMNITLRIRKKHCISPSYAIVKVGIGSWAAVDVSRRDAMMLLIKMRQQNKLK